MLVAAAVCPHPPLLVPQVAGTAAAEMDACRSACRDALQVLRGQSGELVLVGGGSGTSWHAEGEVGSLQPYGVPVQTVLGRRAAPASPTLPLSLTIGAWLAGEWDGPVSGLEVAVDADPQECRRLGAQAATRADRVSMLVLADGSARRGPTAPGYTDARALPYDAAVEQALAAGDLRALADLDPHLAADLLVGGRAALQVLAGAAGSAAWEGRVLYADDPYGVRYTVAVWTLRG